MVLGNSGNTTDEELALQAYPNPFNDGLHIRIESNAYDVADVVITDVAGRKLETRMAQPTNAEIVVGRTLAAGTYLVEVKHGNVSRQIKVVKLQ
jgi:hypothetical protein